MNKLAVKSRIEVNDIMASYTDNDKSGAPYIIFIHGFPFNKSMWNLQAEALMDKYHVITYDIRGHGDSEMGNEPFSIDLFAKDLIGLMDILKIGKTMLCGLSMGGYISLNAVTNFPERFNALVLSDTQCAADTPEVKEKRMKAITNIRENGVKKYAEESIKNLFSPESFLTRKNAIEDVTGMILKTSEQSLCSTLLALAMRAETCSKLPEIKIPVLVLVGKEDILTTPEAAIFMNNKIKNSSLHIVDHAGHLSNMENPYKFNYELKRFVSAVL